MPGPGGFKDFRQFRERTLFQGFFHLGQAGRERVLIVFGFTVKFGEQNVYSIFQIRLFRVFGVHDLFAGNRRVPFQFFQNGQEEALISCLQDLQHKFLKLLTFLQRHIFHALLQRRVLRQGDHFQNGFRNLRLWGFVGLGIVLFQIVFLQVILFQIVFFEFFVFIVLGGGG